MDHSSLNQFPANHLEIASAKKRGILPEVIISILLFFWTFGSAQAVVYVDQNATGLNNGTSWSNAYTDLRTALLQTSNDEVWVAAGTYKPAGPDGDQNLSFPINSGVRLYGGFAGTESSIEQRNSSQNETILSGDLNGDDVYRYKSFHDSWWNLADNSYHVVTIIDALYSPVVDGFVIGHGVGMSASGIWLNGGGGMEIVGSAPTISNVIIEGNTGMYGGGVFIANAQPTFINCEFASNAVDFGQAGAVYVSSHPGPSEVVFENCNFVRNAVVGVSINTGDGGAIYIDFDSTVHINDSVFNANQATHPTYGGGDPTRGGAITSAGYLSITNSRFIDNKGHWGGAIYSYTDMSLNNTLFTDNQAMPAFTGSNLSGGYGGAIFLLAVRPHTFNIAGNTIANNTAAENAGGIYAAGDATLNLDNSIIWNNKVTKYLAPDEDPIPLLKQQVHTVTNAQVNYLYSDVQGLLTPIPGEDPPVAEDFVGCRDTDPMFLDSDFDLRLSPDSPLIDAGNNAGIPVGTVVDLDNNGRRFDDPATPDTGNGTAPIVDMGAYEFGSLALDQLPPLPADEPPPETPTTTTTAPPADKPAEPVEMKGIIESINAGSIVVSGITVIITADTDLQFEDGTDGIFVIGFAAEYIGLENADGSVNTTEIQVSP